MEKGIASADVRQKCIAKTLSFGSTFHQASDIDDIQIGRYFAAIWNLRIVELLSLNNFVEAASYLAGLWYSTR